MQAKLLAQGGSITAAIALATDAVRVAATTDSLNRHARALHDLGEVHTIAGSTSQARAAYTAALGLYEAKENAVATEQMRSLLQRAAFA